MSLQSVSKTIQVLETFFKFPEGRASVSNLALELGWSRAAVHQYVSTLAEVGWLQQNKKRDYQLSPRAAVFGRFAIQHAGIPSVVSTVMESLVRELNEPISYAVLNGDEAIIVERHEPRRPFAITHAAEPHLQLTTSASGLVLLAFDGHVDVAQTKGLEDALAEVRLQGFAESHSEWMGDVVDVVAVPIMAQGECLGAVSVIAPSGRMDMPTARQALLKARGEMEGALE